MPVPWRIDIGLTTSSAMSTDDSFKNQIDIPRTPCRMVIVRDGLLTKYFCEGSELSKTDKDAFEKSIALQRQAEKEPGQAIKLLHDSIDVFPKNPGAYEQLALSFIAKKQFPRALETLNKGIAAVPESPELYRLKVTALMGLRNDTMALANADALVRYAPDSANFCLRAEVRRQLGDKVGAERDFMSALTASKQVGDDALGVVKTLTSLTGKKLRRPAFDANASRHTFDSIVNLMKNPQRYDEQFVAQKLGLKFYEIPIKNDPSIKTSEFALAP